MMGPMGSYNDRKAVIVVGGGGYLNAMQRVRACVLKGLPGGLCPFPGGLMTMI